MQTIDDPSCKQGITLSLADIISQFNSDPLCWIYAVTGSILSIDFLRLTILISAFLSVLS